MKNIFVVGAHGHVGQKLVPQLAQAGYHVLAGVRQKNDLTEWADLSNIDLIEFDLNSMPEEMATVFKRSAVDAIIFTAGSGGNTGDDKTLSIDLDGAIKTMEAAEQANVNRYLMVSAAHSDNRKLWPQSGLQGYFIAKHYADEFLRRSKLEYTIIRPTTLSNDEPSQKVDLDPKELSADSSISRSNVAQVLVQILNNKRTIRKTIVITDGNTPIKEL